MKIISNRKEKIFRKDFNDKPVYKIGLSKKDINGNYINGYMLCNFKKGTDIPDKSFINIKSGWIDFYLKDKETVPFIFINDFELLDDNKKEIEVYEVESFKAEDLDTSSPDLPFWEIL